MDGAAQHPRISVVIPTFNRAGLLRLSLDSLARQRLARNDYEVVVINDGSTDQTARLCAEFSGRMNLRHYRIENSGISAAKNLGIFTARAPILFFFDDDDVAHCDLLSRHLAMHERNPEENIAILGYTTWAPILKVTPLMDYVLNVGQFLFAYKHLKDQQMLDFTYFWGGRSSCKRSLLVRHGVFNQRFGSIIEDIELGYRLSRFGLRVVFDRKAISYMTRELTFDEFCRRSERQGRALATFCRFHDEPAVREYCRIPEPINCELEEAADRWGEIEPRLVRNIERVRDLEGLIESEGNGRLFESTRSEVHGLYRWCINASKLKGLAEGLATSSADSIRLGDRIAVPAS